MVSRGALEWPVAMAGQWLGLSLLRRCDYAQRLGSGEVNRPGFLPPRCWRHRVVRRVRVAALAGDRQAPSSSSSRVIRVSQSGHVPPRPRRLAKMLQSSTAARRSSLSW